QKIIRDTKRRYYHVKTAAPKLAREWGDGATLSALARKANFPPVLTASMILEHMNVTKNTFREYIQDPSRVPNPRLKTELVKALAEDLVYSPEGTTLMWERGKDVERRVKQWLNENRIKYITEYDAKKSQHIKTPDFRLESPVKMYGKWVNWIECKASFGDDVEARRDYFKQLVHYVDLFGQGIVVYWYGFLEGALKDSHIIITDKRLVEGIPVR
ncbi:MAG: TPD domain-containing protein, partial [Candidatus Altiarchaeota archaeon]|nr:TPD domain-containing protein [Candidatus Altiarchaeota archaeon]